MKRRIKTLAGLAPRCAQEARHSVFPTSEGSHAVRGGKARLSAYWEAGK
jgi:hypothetical protein